MPNHLSQSESTKTYCHQFLIREKNFDTDLKNSNLTQKEINSLKVSDFTFKFIPKEDRETCKKIKEFVERHEWLGKMPHRPTHRFAATYKGELAGVIVMATPNAFSNLLGKENRDKEKLISRGACISWSPKNLGSALVMYSIRWMVKNTHFRYFSAYSDVSARELGTIYQACNFHYLGQNSGARFEYFDPSAPEKGWFSDRYFRKSTSIKRYALELGIKWKGPWSYRDKIFWEKIPKETKERLKEASKAHQSTCRRRALPRKHKYVYILGDNKRETKALRNLFYKLNPKKSSLPYPKMRGVDVQNFTQGSRRPLTGRPESCWPTSMEDTPQKRLFSIKEVSKMYGLSQWLIYQHIKADPTFPVVNVGLKKRFLIDIKRLEAWLIERTRKQQMNQHDLPSTGELMEA